MLLLRNHDNFRRLAALDPRSKALRLLAPLDASRRRRPAIVGHWTDLSGMRIAVYSDGETARMWWDGDDFDLRDVDEASLTRIPLGPGRELAKLVVTRKDGRPLLLSYETPLADVWGSPRPADGAAADDPRVTREAGDEDLDFGLFIVQVARDRGRQQWLIDRARSVLGDELAGYDEPTHSFGSSVTGTFRRLLNRLEVGQRARDAGERLKDRQKTSL